MAANSDRYGGISEFYLRRAADMLTRMGRGASRAYSVGSAAMREWTGARPLRAKIAREAQIPIEHYLTEAALDTSLSYDRSRDVMERNLERMGVDPSSGRYAGMQQEWALARAAAEVGARARARRKGRQESFGRMIDAAKLYQDMPRTALSAYSTAAPQLSQAASGLMNVAGTDYGALARTSAAQERINRVLRTGTGGLTMSAGAAAAIAANRRRQQYAQTSSRAGVYGPETKLGPNWANIP